VEAAGHGDTRRLHGLRDQLAEQALLGEVLRADDDAVGVPTRDGERREQEERSHGTHRKRRSIAPSRVSAASAIAAAGNAPPRMRALSSEATPAKTSVPSPPAPIGAAIVATPTPITVASRMPAMMTLAASGSSTRRKSCASVMPMPTAASRSPGSIDAMPVTVFRRIGSNAYSVSATSAVRVPIPKKGSGISRPKSARL